MFDFFRFGLDDRRDLRSRCVEQSEQFRAQHFETRQISIRHERGRFDALVVQKAKLEFQLVELRREIFQRLGGDKNILLANPPEFNVLV